MPEKTKTSGRGGPRVGAGRKPAPKKERPSPEKSVANRVLARIDEDEHWLALLEITNPRLLMAKLKTTYRSGLEVARLVKEHREILRDLTYLRDGRPPLMVDHSGDVNHHHSFESLSDADLNKEIGKLREFSEGGESSPGATARGEGEAARA
jgi:hypothetical protein